MKHMLLKLTSAEANSLLDLVERKLETGEYYGYRKHYTNRLSRIKAKLENEIKGIRNADAGKPKR
jgi:hypothetical protein